MSESQLSAKASDKFAVCDTTLRRFNNSVKDVFGRAGCCTSDGVKTALNVALASSLLEVLETSNVLIHARQIGPLDRLVHPIHFVALIAVDSDHPLFARLELRLKG